MRDIDAKPPLLEVRELYYAYPDGHEALRDVSLDLMEGEKMALVGANGSGKSTLLLHLAGALAAQKGDVLLRGESVGEDLGRLREAVGLVFQEPDDQLFMPTVLEDAAFGLVARGMPSGEAQARAMEVLEVLGAAHLAARPPHRLSGGEKRMAALAGVLAMEPKVLILDEPTAALDPRARRRVIETLQGMEGTALIATHDLDMALDLCSRAVILSGGRAAASGALPDLFRDETMLQGNGLELPLRYSGLQGA